MHEQKIWESRIQKSYVLNLNFEFKWETCWIFYDSQLLRENKRMAIRTNQIKRRTKNDTKHKSAGIVCDESEVPCLYIWRFMKKLANWKLEKIAFKILS